MQRPASRVKHISRKWLKLSCWSQLWIHINIFLYYIMSYKHLFLRFLFMAFKILLCPWLCCFYLGHPHYKIRPGKHSIQVNPPHLLTRIGCASCKFQPRLAQKYARCEWLLPPLILTFSGSHKVRCLALASASSKILPVRYNGMAFVLAKV